jgi:hypothetical protein
MDITRCGSARPAQVPRLVYRHTADRSLVGPPGAVRVAGASVAFEPKRALRLGIPIWLGQDADRHRRPRLSRSARAVRRRLTGTATAPLSRLTTQLQLRQVQPFAERTEDHAHRERGEQHAHHARDHARARHADHPRNWAGGEQDQKLNREHGGKHADCDHLSERIETIVIGQQDRREHGARAGDFGDGERIDRKREVALVGALRAGAAVAADHLECDQEQEDAAGNLERPDRHIHLIKQKRAGEDEEDEHGKRDEDRINRDPALRRGSSEAATDKNTGRAAIGFMTSRNVTNSLKCCCHHMRSSDSFPRCLSVRHAGTPRKQQALPLQATEFPAPSQSPPPASFPTRRPARAQQNQRAVAVRLEHRCFDVPQIEPILAERVYDVRVGPKLSWRSFCA